MKYFKIALTAGESVTLAHEGNCLHVVAASDPIRVTLPGLGVETVLRAQLGVELERTYQAVQLLSDTSQTVEILAGHGRVIDSRTAVTLVDEITNVRTVDSVSSVVAVESVERTASLGAARLAATAVAAELVAARAARKSLTIYNEGASPAYVGPAGVTAANGFPVPPGGALTLRHHTGAVSAIMGAGCTANLYAVEEY